MTSVVAVYHLRLRMCLYVPSIDASAGTNMPKHVHRYEGEMIKQTEKQCTLQATQTAIKCVCVMSWINRTHCTIDIIRFKNILVIFQIVICRQMYKCSYLIVKWSNQKRLSSYFKFPRKFSFTERSVFFAQNIGWPMFYHGSSTWSFCRYCLAQLHGRSAYACIAPRTLCDVKLYWIHLRNDSSWVEWDAKPYNSTQLHCTE